MAQFGTPLPSTLQTKSAQAVSGLTGFYPNTGYVEGALLLARAYLAKYPSRSFTLRNLPSDIPASQDEHDQ